MSLVFIIIDVRTQIFIFCFLECILFHFKVEGRQKVQMKEHKKGGEGKKADNGKIIKNNKKDVLAGKEEV